MILLTAPVGPTIADLIYRAAPPADVYAWDGARFTELHGMGGPTALLDEHGHPWVFLHEEDAPPTRLETRCDDLAAEGNVVACLAGEELTLLAPDDGGTWRAATTLPLDEPGHALGLSGNALAVVLDSGAVQLATVTSGALETHARITPPRRPDFAAPLPGALLLGLGDTLRVIPIGNLDAPGTPADLDVGEPTSGAFAWSGELFLASASGVLRLDLTDLGAPAIQQRIPTASAVRDFAGVNRRMVYAETADGLVPLIAGPLGGWRAGSTRGLEADVRDLTGRPERQPGLRADGTVVVVDVFPARNGTIYVIGALALLAAGSWLGFLAFRRPEGWKGRLVWTLVAGAAAVWVLGDRFDRPVEAFHLIEFGLLGGVLHRAAAVRERALSAVGFALAFGLLASLLDETVHWLLPNRTGDLADVWLDLKAIAIGVLAWNRAVEPVPLRLGRAWDLPALGLAAGLLWITAYQHGVHGVGGHFEGPPGVTFYSRLDPDTIRQIDATQGEELGRYLDRTAAMDHGHFLRTHPPGSEPYLYELRVRLYRRARRLERGDVQVACGEHRILRAWYPNTVTGTVWEWPPALAERCEPYSDTPYDSPVSDEIIASVGPATLWTLSGAASLSLLGLAVWLGRRRRT